MLIIGLTGGIGAGKSLVSDCFAQLGVPVIDADVIAREVVAPGKSAYAAIRRAFGDAVFLADGNLDRAGLRRLVFADSGYREKLESIVHPLVRREIENRLQSTHAPYTIVCVPLLLEKNYRGIVHRVLVIDVPEEVQLERVKKRDRINTDQANAIIQTQIRRQDRLSQADEVIDNSADVREVQRRVMQLHEQYQQLAPTYA